MLDSLRPDGDGVPRPNQQGCSSVETTGDVRASSLLFQRISIEVQRFNSVLLRDGVLLMMTGQSRFTSKQIS